MLEELHIRDLGVIAEARLEFAPGLNVLTGETGTGKTLVVGALGALLGARTEAGHVRSGAEQAFVEARFSASGGWAALGIEGDELVLARGIPGRKGGKGRVFLQGRMAAPGVLAEVARGLVEIQSQRDSHRLLKTAEQRDLLDRFAGDEALSVRSELAGAVSDMRRSQAELEELVGRERERARELESLRYEIEEIRQADIDPGEESRLESEESLLANAERLRETAEQARETLAGEQGAQASVGSARRQLGAVAEMDPILGEAARRLEQAGYEIEDVASGLRRHAESLEANPERLESVRRRRRLLGELKRKYGANLEEVMRYREQAERRWADLEGAQEGRVKLEWEITRLRTRRDGLAVRLSSHREKAAKRLCRAVGQELRDLAMDAARVDVVFHRRGDPGGPMIGGQAVVVGEAGAEEVEFLLSANSGEPPRPLAKVASGGELSRAMLAFRVVLAGADETATLIFDEADAGVAGRAAVALGRKLACLARVHQVVCVTHLPQVAAFADRHFVVAKRVEANRTIADVAEVRGGERVAEVSRMLAGIPESELAVGHAEELLAAAEATRTEV